MRKNDSEERAIEESDWYDIVWATFDPKDKRKCNDSEFLDILIKEGPMKNKVVRIWRDGTIIIEKWDRI